MQPKHAKLTVDKDGNVFLEPVSAGCHLYLNG